MGRTRGPSIGRELLSKSREAALNAVQTFNNPLTTFKTETFIVLMVIAWTYLLHAYYRQQGVEYRYYKKGPKRRIFERQPKSRAFKYWDLERCLNERTCPLDGPTKHNLRFLIGLRHEIEHHQSAGVDEAFTGRYVACFLNYEREITRIFGLKYSVASNMSYALQLRDLTLMPPEGQSVKPLPTNISRYMSQFDAELPQEEYQHPHFSYRLLFVRKLAAKPSQSDQVIEFVSADSDVGKAIDKRYWVQKDVERRKYLPGEIVKLMREEGYTGFKQHHHTQLWQRMQAKEDGKGYGTLVAITWYWYDRWVDEVREYCKNNANLYTPGPEETVASLHPGSAGSISDREGLAPEIRPSVERETVNA